MKVILFLFNLSYLVKLNHCFLWDNFNIDRLFKNSEIIFERLRPGSTQAEEVCLNQFKYFVDNVKRSETWALRGWYSINLEKIVKFSDFYLLVLDSWGKMPTGIYSGNNLDLGHYDQCYTTEHDSKSTIIGYIEPLYCQIRVQDASVTRNSSFAMAVCVPKSCSPTFMLRIMTEFLNNIDYKAVAVHKPLRCYDTQKEKFGVIQWITITLIIILIGLMITGTVYDLFYLRKNKEEVQPNFLLKSFSVASNADKLMEVRHDKSGNTMECLNGLRVISIGYVVILHCFEYYGFTPAIYNRDGTEHWEKTWGHSFMRHGDAIVETFFCITGVLISYNFLKGRERGEKFNTFKYYIHRFFRIAPVYYAAILFVIAFIPYLGDGPSYQRIIEPALHQNCVKYWWSALLFIQNWVNPWIHTVSKK